MAEMHSAELRDLIGERLSMDLKAGLDAHGSRPHGEKGRPDPHRFEIQAGHRAALPEPRLERGRRAPAAPLHDHDLTRYAAEISPDAGRCLIFKVTPNCWHDTSLSTASGAPSSSTTSRPKKLASTI